MCSASWGAAKKGLSVTLTLSTQVGAPRRKLRLFGNCERQIVNQSTLLKLRAVWELWTHAVHDYGVPAYNIYHSPKVLKKTKNYRFSAVSCGKLLCVTMHSVRTFWKNSFLAGFTCHITTYIPEKWITSRLWWVSTGVENPRSFSQSTWPIAAQNTMTTRKVLEFSQNSPLKASKQPFQQWFLWKVGSHLQRGTCFFHHKEAPGIVSSKGVLV